MPSCPYPALFTRTSIRAISLSTFATAEPIAAKSVTSSSKARARVGCIASKANLASSFRTVPTTECPDESASAANALPNPEPAPVIRMLRPACVVINFSVVVRGADCRQRVRIVASEEPRTRRGPTMTANAHPDHQPRLSYATLTRRNAPCDNMTMAIKLTIIRRRRS